MICAAWNVVSILPEREKDFTCREVTLCHHIAREHWQEIGMQSTFARTLRFRSLGILQVKQNVCIYILGRTEQLPAGEILGLLFQI